MEVEIIQKLDEVEAEIRERLKAIAADESSNYPIGRERHLLDARSKIQEAIDCLLLLP